MEDRAKRVHPDYCRSLHEVDKEAGTKCAAPRLASGKCSYGANGWDDSRHNKGGGERYLVSEFGTVQPLVFARSKALRIHAINCKIEGFSKIILPSLFVVLCVHAYVSLCLCVSVSE